eukprot:6202708-Pleurochrysis_carterae.AAC.3
MTVPGFNLRTGKRTSSASFHLHLQARTLRGPTTAASRSTRALTQPRAQGHCARATFSGHRAVITATCLAFFFI